MPPAARILDDHACPAHGKTPVTSPCATTVLIEGLPAARVGDLCACSPPDPIVQGSPTVLIEFRPASRIGDATQHQGILVKGAPTVIIGEIGAGTPYAPHIAMGVAGFVSTPGQGQMARTPPGHGPATAAPLAQIGQMSIAAALGQSAAWAAGLLESTVARRTLAAAAASGQPLVCASPG